MSISVMCCCRSPLLCVHYTPLSSYHGSLLFSTVHFTLNSLIFIMFVLFIAYFTHLAPPLALTFEWFRIRWAPTSLCSTSQVSPQHPSVILWWIHFFLFWLCNYFNSTSRSLWIFLIFIFISLNVFFPSKNTWMTCVTWTLWGHTAGNTVKNVITVIAVI